MNPPSILIVDDEQPLARNLEYLFRQEGWEAQAVFSGEEALELISKRTFDVVLLDVRMPKLNGFVTLEGMLKLRPHLCVVFFTAFGDVDSAVKALRMGAWSMVMKGPRFEQVFEVVNSARLQWCRLEDQKQQADAERQQRWEETASRKEVEARLDATRNLAQGVAHQVKNRLADCGWDLTTIEEATELSTAKRAAGRLRESLELVELCVNTQHDLWRLQSDPKPDLESISVRVAVKEGNDIAVRHMARRTTRIQAVLHVPDELKVRCIRGLLPQVFENLFHNAMQAIGDAVGQIEVATETRDDLVAIRVSDNGPGFSPEMLGTAHLPYVTSKKGPGQSSPAQNMGLGLFFVNEVVERGGGSMHYGNRQPQGAMVEFTLPLAK